MPDPRPTKASHEKLGLFGGVNDAWTYDAIGNRLTSTVDGEPRTYTYFKNGTNPLNGQRLASDGDLHFTYDALNQMASHFTYDARNQMVSRTVPGINSSFAHKYRASTSHLSSGSRPKPLSPWDWSKHDGVMVIHGTHAMV